MQFETILMKRTFLSILDQWVDLGWIRPLDRAFVYFLQNQVPQALEPVLLAAALTSHQLGRGHTCLDLKEVLRRPQKVLSIPPKGNSGVEPAPPPSELLKNISLNEWETALYDSPVVGDGPGDTPLVLDTKRMYLRRFWQHTQDTAKHINRRLSQPQQDPENLIESLDRQFAPLRTQAEQKKEEVHWQSVAAAMAVKSAFSIISGGPGTGKTTTVVHLIALLQALALKREKKLRIRLAAPTGKASARLTESIGNTVSQLPERLQSSIPVDVVTLHRLLGSRPGTRRFTYHANNQLHIDLLVVDEASMIDLEMMAAVLAALHAEARLILLGDKDQLASVEAGSVLGDLSRNWNPQGYSSEIVGWIEQHTGYSVPESKGPNNLLGSHITVLQKSHRFGDDSGIGALARAVNKGQPAMVEAVWDKGFKDIQRIELPEINDRRFANLILGSRDRIDDSKGYRNYLERLRDGHPGIRDEDPWLKRILTDFDRFRLLSPVRKGLWGVQTLNEQTATILYRHHLITAKDGWYPGRPVIMTRNDYSLGLMNGDTGILLPVTDKTNPKRLVLRVVFPLADGSLKKVLPSRLDNVQTVYAMTVHKAQGSEFDHTVLAFPDRIRPILTRELIYTAITRSRTRFTLVGSRLEFMSECVKKRVYRASGLGDLFH